MLLPEPPAVLRLVLIEVNRHDAPDAAAKMIGQLLMYYAGALEIGQVDLGRLQAYARNTTGQKPPRYVSAQEVCREPGTKHRPSIVAAWDDLHRGDKLRPEGIHLYIALDGLPPPSALMSLETLHKQGIKIGVIRANFELAKVNVCRTSEPTGWQQLRGEAEGHNPRRGWRK
jgi:hypothetical protein